MSSKRAAVRFASRVANYSGLSHCHKVAWKHAASDLATGVQRYQLPAGMASFVRDDGTVIDLDEIGPIEVTDVGVRVDAGRPAAGGGRSMTTLRIDGPIGVTTAELAAGLDHVAAASRDYAAFLRGALESLCDSMGMPRRCLDEVVRDD